MLPCHNLWDLKEQRGRDFLNHTEGGWENPQTGTFMGRHKETA